MACENCGERCTAVEVDGSGQWWCSACQKLQPRTNDGSPGRRACRPPLICWDPACGCSSFVVTPCESSAVPFYRDNKKRDLFAPVGEGGTKGGMERAAAADTSEEDRIPLPNDILLFPNMLHGMLQDYFNMPTASSATVSKLNDLKQDDTQGVCSLPCLPSCLHPSFPPSLSFFLSPPAPPHSAPHHISSQALTFAPALSLSGLVRTRRAPMQGLVCACFTEWYLRSVHILSSAPPRFSLPPLLSPSSDHSRLLPPPPHASEAGSVGRERPQRPRPHRRSTTLLNPRRMRAHCCVQGGASSQARPNVNNPNRRRLAPPSQRAPPPHPPPTY